MSIEALPKSVDYGEPLGVLPSGTENYNVTCYAQNGSVFSPNSQIIVDLNNVGYLDQKSLSFRYKLTVTVPVTTANNTLSIIGCPVYQPFIRVDTLFNSNVVESLNNFNCVANALTNLNMSISDKMGVATAYGYVESVHPGGATLGTATDVSLVNENTDGLTIQTVAALTVPATKEYFLSAPLPCLLSNAEKLIPLNGTNIRLQFTLDSLANITAPASAQGTQIFVNATNQVPFSAITISNFEVVYNQIQFPPQIERQILSIPKIRIKTSSYATGLQTVPVGTSGTVNLVYNLRYASIKAMVLLLGGSSDRLANNLMDSVDITSGSGSYNFQVNGVYYPQNALSTANNKSGILIELRRAMKNMYTGNNAMSINNTEFSFTDASIGSTISATNTKVNVPGKFYVGVNTQKMDTPALFTGISSQNSPITAVINMGGTATVNSYSPILMLYYDGIIEIDTLTKQVNYIY